MDNMQPQQPQQVQQPMANTVRPPQKKSGNKLAMGLATLVFIGLSGVGGYVIGKSGQKDLEAKVDSLEQAATSNEEKLELYNKYEQEIDASEKGLDEQYPLTSDAEGSLEEIQMRARDTERKTDINAIHVQLEVYFTDFGNYPDGGTQGPELSVSTLPGIDIEAFTDPSGSALSLGDINTAAAPGYYYNPINCSAGSCGSYELGALLESEAEGIFKKVSLN